MNQIIIHGRLTRDPEFTPRANSEGSDRVNFTVADDRRFGDETNFHRCVCFGKRAGVIDKYFQKGSEILIRDGEVQLRPYTDKNGVKRDGYSVIVHDFDFCGSKNKSENQSVSNADLGDNWEQFDEDNPFDV